MVTVQSAGFWPLVMVGPVCVRSRCHEPAPVMFIWYLALIDVASAAFFARIAGSCSLNSWGISTAMMPLLRNSCGYASVSRDVRSASRKAKGLTNGPLSLYLIERASYLGTAARYLRGWH